MLASSTPLAQVQAPSASIVVITDLDATLRHAGVGSLAAAPALKALAKLPLVLCSGRKSAELRAIQRELGIRHPFIADGGAALHIPVGYFCTAVESASDGGIDNATDEEGYETIDFGVRRVGHAVRLVVALYRACSAPPLVVGIGGDWRDRVLLREVDVPVVIRDPSIDQSALLRNVPHAYLTDASGDDGLLEIIFGDGSVGRG